MLRASQLFGAPAGPQGPAKIAAAAAAASVASKAPSAFPPADAAPVANAVNMPHAPAPAQFVNPAAAWPGTAQVLPAASTAPPPQLPGAQAAAAALAAASSGACPQTGFIVPMQSSSGTRSFEPAASFLGARPGKVFKLDYLGLGYYLDSTQTLIPELRPKLPERWRDANLREERLQVDTKAGAGVSLEHTEFGFAIEKVEAVPGQQMQKGEVIVAMEGRVLAGLSAPQMQASFQKRRINGARVQVASLAEVKELATRDPAVIECWDAQHQRPYYFHKLTAKVAWTREELKVAQPAAETPKQGNSDGNADGPGAPIDLANFLSHGFAKQKEPPQKKRKKEKTEGAGEKKELEKDESDMSRAEKARWNDWNEGGRGGYTLQFLDKYRNCTSWESKPKQDKRMKGSVGPGHGNEYVARWTGSNNSFN